MCVAIRHYPETGQVSLDFENVQQRTYRAESKPIREVKNAEVRNAGMEWRAVRGGSVPDPA